MGDPTVSPELQLKLDRQTTMQQLYDQMKEGPSRCPVNGCDLPVGPLANVVVTIHDSILYWTCGRCGAKWHRHPEGHPLRAKAVLYVGRE